MRAVIVGAGRAGTGLAGALAKAGHTVTLVDRDAEVAARAFAEHGVATIVGDGASPDLLRSADVPRADVVAAMLRRDADNLAVAVATRSMSEARVVARLRDPSYRKLYEDVGVDHVFGEVETLVDSLRLAVEHRAIGHSLVLGGGETVAFEVHVDGGAPVVGKAVKDLAADPAFPSSVVLATIEAPGQAPAAARGESEIVASSSVLLVARRGDVAAALAFFLGPASRASRVRT